MASAAAAAAKTSAVDPVVVQLQSTAAEIVVELALCRGKLSGLVEALSMLIKLVSMGRDAELCLDAAILSDRRPAAKDASPLAAPAPPPAGLGLINSFAVTAPPQLGAVRSRRRSASTSTSTAVAVAATATVAVAAADDVDAPNTSRSPSSSTTHRTTAASSRQSQRDERQRARRSRGGSSSEREHQHH